MKFEKKLIILSGGSFAKGTLNLERNSFGTFATFNVYNLPDLNDGEYAAGIKNSSMTFKRNLGSLGRVLIRFKLDDTELDNVHCVIYDTVNEEPILYGTSAPEKLWDGNMMDGFREKRSGATVAAQSVGTALNDVGGYFLDILKRGDAGYCDNAVAAVNYYPQDMNIEVTYSGREKQPPVVNPLDEALRKRNELNGTAVPKAVQMNKQADIKDKLTSEGADIKAEQDSDNTDINAKSDSNGMVNGLNSVSNSTGIKSKSDSGDTADNSGKKPQASEADSVVGTEDEFVFMNAEKDRVGGEAEVLDKAVSKRLDDEIKRLSEELRALNAELAERPERNMNNKTLKTLDNADAFASEPEPIFDTKREPISLRKPIVCETDGGADFVVFEPPLKGARAVVNESGDRSAKKKADEYENATSRANEGETAGFKTERQVNAVPQMSRENSKNISENRPINSVNQPNNSVNKFNNNANNSGTVVKAASIPAMGEAAATVPPVSRYTADKAINSTVTKAVFYEMVKSQIDELFVSYPPYEPLEKMMPDTKWVKVDYDGNGKYYVVGLIGTNPDYLCYGVPSRYNPEPPKDLDGYCQWMPIDAEKPEGDGFWLMFQDAVSGESVSRDI